MIKELLLNPWYGTIVIFLSQIFMLYLRTLNIVYTTIKFMRYSKREALIGVEKVHKDRLEDMMSYLESTGMIVEYYEPPGIDIGASCGQFLINKYELIDKQNEKTY
jgi:ribosomal protein L30E